MFGKRFFGVCSRFVYRETDVWKEIYWCVQHFVCRETDVGKEIFLVYAAGLCIGRLMFGK